MNKLFKITFSRGSGLCYDEVIEIVTAETLEHAIQKGNAYRDKYYKRGWYMDVKMLEQDSEGFFTVSETYG